MASLKKIGFFWGEEKITAVEFEKNAPVKVVFSPLAAKANTSSPFSSNLTEEIQITVLLKKLLEDNEIKGGTFYVSLPMKEIILRSFIIPFVKSADIQTAIKFEAKKYIPFDIQDLSFAYHTIPFVEGQNKRLQVIFFAARKEVLARYERIFKQANTAVSYCEPYIVSLAKSLLFRKEVKPTDHFAFLILDKNLGRICFIDKGIPQFIREFPVSSLSSTSETNEAIGDLNLKIVNEVLNSFDFYSRQFNGEKIEQLLVSSEFVQKDLINTLEAELKLKITKFSPAINTGALGSSNDMDAIYAMGACVASPLESLSNFNLLGDKTPKSQVENKYITALMPFKETILVFILCVVFLIGIFVFFQMQLKLAQNQYNQFSAQEGTFLNEPQDSIQAEIKSSTDQLQQYKTIKTKSDLSYIILKLASHLPQGALIVSLIINFDAGDSDHAVIDIKGEVVLDDPNQQIAVVNQVYSDFKNDKDLTRFFSTVNLVSFNPEAFNGRQATAFSIHCS